MEANIIKVGNSKGIIIPAKFLKLIGLKTKVNIEVSDSKLIIEPLEVNIRNGWKEMFQKANSKDDKDNLIPDVFEDENLPEWTW